MDNEIKVGDTVRRKRVDVRGPNGEGKVLEMSGPNVGVRRCVVQWAAKKNEILLHALVKVN